MSWDAQGRPRGETVFASAQGASQVTPDNSNDLLLSPTKGVYLGGGGDVKITMMSGDVVTFTGMAAGVIHPISAKRIHSTGTTATAIVAVY